MTTSRPGVVVEEIGVWSEVKLEIVKAYVKAYSTILSKRKLYHVYIDAFSGSGLHLSKATKGFVLGSPLNALHVSPPFKEYFFIDLDGEKISALKKHVGTRSDVHIFEGDCNQVLLDKVFPQVTYDQYRRGLCLVDPYKMQPRWEVIERAGKMRSIELIINFPIMDINRNALLRDQGKVDPKEARRMTTYWGDETWKTECYSKEGNLFGWEEKTDNTRVAEAYRRRLKSVAGFAYVPEPLPMKNSQGAVVYYLFFASHRPVGGTIMTEIFNKYRRR